MSKNLINLMLFLTVIQCFVFITRALPTPDEDRYIDKEQYNRDLLNWLNAVQYPQQFNNPCKYYFANGILPTLPKRNSELINSLLSLPKNMNDAGK